MSRFPGWSAVGSGGDAAHGLVLGRVGFVVFWGLGWLLVAGLWRQGVPQTERWRWDVMPLSLGAECFRSQGKARDHFVPRWLRPVVGRWWGPSNVVGLAGVFVPHAWLQVLAMR